MGRIFHHKNQQQRQQHNKHRRSFKNNDNIGQQQKCLTMIKQV